MLIEASADGQGQPKTAAMNAIYQRIDTLNQHFTNNEIDRKVLPRQTSKTVFKRPQSKLLKTFDMSPKTR